MKEVESMNGKKDSPDPENAPRIIVSRGMPTEIDLDMELNTVPLSKGADTALGEDTGCLIEPMVRERDSGLPFYSGFRKRTGFSLIEEAFKETHTDMRTLEECDVLISIALLITDLDYVEAVNLIACAGAVLSRDMDSDDGRRDLVLRSLQGRISDAYESYDRMMGDYHHPLIETVDDFIEFGLRDDFSDIMDVYLEKAEECIDSEDGDDGSYRRGALIP